MVFSQQLSLILPYIATSISFNTLLFTAYLRTVPKELDEAALMDGVSLWQLMTKILVPIAKPVLATVIIFNLLYIWNEYPFASIMIEKPAYYTISRGIAAFQGQYNIDYGGLAAYSVMVLLPELVFYGIFQRHVVDGMTVGAVKGVNPTHTQRGCCLGNIPFLFRVYLKPVYASFSRSVCCRAQ